MISHVSCRYVAALRLLLYVGAAVAALALLHTTSNWRQALAQDQAAEEPAGPSGERIVTAADVIPEAKPAAQSERPALNIFALAVAGGIFMIPIAGMSLLAVTMTIERFLALRRERVLPEELVSGLGAMAAGGGAFDPRKAYRLCQQFPSAAASVVRVMLLKVGRPLPEVESAVAHASQREADKLYANVRWINLAASLSTMLGLIGTIQGMIMAFHRLTVIDAAADRTTALADGIYTALVTTFAGLAVAIPALLFSHYFEGRIQELFRQIDELTFNLLPQVERYEGRVRFGSAGDHGQGEPGAAEPAEASAS